MTDTITPAMRSRHARPAAGPTYPDVLSWRTVDSPVGALLAIATSRGLLRLAFECEDFDAVMASLSRRTGARARRAPDRLDAVAAELEEYFTGQRRSFDIAVDRSLSSGFRAQVQQLMTRIGYGQTVSYGQLAVLAGSPGASRAVGGACATNPLPIVVPCHRVVRSNGGLGGYVGGIEAKRALLDLETAPDGTGRSQCPANSHP